jgi:hypothetical protein
VKIRPFQPGDEYAQLEIYNAAAASLSKFKPASIPDIQRRTQAKDFDSATRLYAEEQGRVVAYCTYQSNGRIGYPWSLPGFEATVEPLFVQTLQSMRQRGQTRAFTAYRKDWPTITEFFQRHGFILAREMVNFIMSFENMPTPSARVSTAIAPATIEDVPGIFALDPTVFRVPTAEALQKALFENPWFKPDNLFVMRIRKDDAPVAAGVFITEAQYADPRAVDPDMPCFRLGAFGTEGMTTKRIRGLYSFVARPDRNVFSLGMDLLSFATMRLRDEDEISCYAAQVASDATALHAFYQRTFERQGSFPVFERDLTK